MKSVQSTFNEYFYNLFIIFKVNRKKFLFIIAMVWIAIIISRLMVNDFRQYYHITHVMDTCGIMVLKLSCCPSALLIVFMVVILFLPSRCRVKLKRLNKAILHLNMKKVEILCLMTFYISAELAIVFCVTAVGYLIKRYTFNSAFNLYFLSFMFVYYVILMSLTGLLLLSLLNVFDRYGVRYVKALFPRLIELAKNTLCKIVNPSVVYTDFKIAGLVAIPMVLIMIFSRTYNIYVLSFEKIYIGLIFCSLILGVIVVLLLDKMTPTAHKDYKHVLDPLFNKTKICVRFINFTLMLFIIVYVAFLIFNMQLSITYWGDILGKIFDVGFFAIIFGIYVPLIQIFSKNIHIRKIQYKSSMAKK